MEKKQKVTKTTTAKASKSSKKTTKPAATPKPAPEVKKEIEYAPEPPKEPLYTRIMAVVQVLKANPGIEKELCIEKADALYKEKTGYHHNPKETAYAYRKTINVLHTWGGLI